MFRAGSGMIARRGLVGEHAVGVVIRVLHVHVVRGCAGGDPVEVVRVPLRRHQRLPAAIRAAVEIRIGGRPPVEVPDDRLRDLRRDVHAAIGEVDPRPRLVDDPRCTLRAGMAHVGRGRHEFTCDYRHAAGGLRGVAEIVVPALAAAAVLHVALRPGRHRQLHDDRAGARSDDASHRAVSGGIRRRRIDQRHSREGDLTVVVGHAIQVEGLERLQECSPSWREPPAGLQSTAPLHPAAVSPPQPMPTMLDDVAFRFACERLLDTSPPRAVWDSVGLPRVDKPSAESRLGKQSRAALKRDEDMRNSYRWPVAGGERRRTRAGGVDGAILESASSQTVEVHELFRYITDEGVVPQRFARHPHYELCRCVLLPVPVKILTQP